jgi:hypothetical protein
MAEMTRGFTILFFEIFAEKTAFGGGNPGERFLRGRLQFMNNRDVISLSRPLEIELNLLNYLFTPSLFIAC